MKIYLKDYPQLVVLFEENNPIVGYQDIETFLSLSKPYISPTYFKIEPFYIEDAQLIKECKSIDLDLFLDIENLPKRDPQRDKDLPLLGEILKKTLKLFSHHPTKG